MNDIDLSQFLTHKDEYINNAATTIQELVDAYNANTISKEQFVEMYEDVLQITHINENVEDLERKVRIIEAFNLIKLILSNLP